MPNSLKITIPNTKATTGWRRERGLIERGEQIEAAFSPAAGVQLAGVSVLPKIGNEPEKKILDFICEDVEQALSEFPAVGRQLNFPPGTSLFHFGPDWITSHTAVRTVTTW